MKRTARKLAPAIAVGSLLIAVPAFAAVWAASGSGTASSTAANLAAPAAANGSTVTSSTITVAVTQKPASGPTPTAYRVDRTSTGTPGAATGVCSISADASGLGSCQDSGLQANTTYTYAVFSAIGSKWFSAASLTVSGKTAAAGDTTPPNLPVLTFPVTATAYNAAGWIAGCSTASINDLCGTASDNAGGSGVQKTQVAIQASGGTNNGKYWNGTSFATTTLTWNDATGTTSWSYAFTPPADATYSVQARTLDVAGNTGSASTAVSFTYDTTAPTVSITGATTQSGHAVQVSGSASHQAADSTHSADSSTVTIVLCSTNTNPCTGTTIDTLSATVQSDGSWSVTSGNEGNNTAGFAEATISDGAGNKGTATGRSFGPL